MNFDSLSQRLKTHGLTSIAVLGLLFSLLWMEADGPDPVPLVAVIAFSAATLGQFDAIQTIRENKRLTVTAIGSIGAFLAAPIAFDLVTTLLTYLSPQENPTMYVDDNWVAKPLWLSVLDAFRIDVELLIVLASPAVAVVIAKARPDSVRDLVDLYWVCLPAIALAAAFVYLVDVVYEVAYPTWTAGGPAMVVGTLVAVCVVSGLIAAVLWALGIAVYSHLPDSPSHSMSDAVADGGQRE